jgi:hypothetical protein
VLAAPPDWGVQRPRLSSVPPWTSSTGPEAIELAALAGLDLDPWQQYILTESLGERADGSWASFEVGVLVSRQNGKGGLLEARELAGLFLLNERLLIHSAHLFDTSMEAFRRLLALIEDTPQLSKRVRKVVNSHGQEGIELKSGARIRFRTRTTGGGRGFTCDCLVLDEAMNIPEATHAALLPTLSARPNPQVLYTGSAVDQEVDQNGVVFARVRERGLEGGRGKRVAWFEWSADSTINDVNPEFTADPANWAAANPALGIRIPAEFIEGERDSMSTRKFAVERLGIGDWPRTDDESIRLIDRAAWAACLDTESQPDDPLCLGFDISPDRSWATVAVAGRRADGLAHVEPIQRRRGTGWVVEYLVDRVARHDPAVVVYDGRGPGASLAVELEAAKVPLVGTSAHDYGQSCGMFYDAVLNATLRHIGRPELTAAVDGAATRPLGEAWAWSRKNATTDLTPLVASTLALWGLNTRPSSNPQIFSLDDFWDDEDDGEED